MDLTNVLFLFFRRDDIALVIGMFCILAVTVAVVVLKVTKMMFFVFCESPFSHPVSR